MVLIVFLMLCFEMMLLKYLKNYLRAKALDNQNLTQDPDLESFQFNDRLEDLLFIEIMSMVDLLSVF